MSKLDDIAEHATSLDYDRMSEQRVLEVEAELKKEIKDLVLDIFKEVEYDPFEFVDRVSKL